jgi:hypothetical protein
MEKAYVIMKKGYEYDDNTYNESEGGVPKIICLTEEDADQKIAELNAIEFKSVNLSDYIYDLEDILEHGYDQYKELCDRLLEKYGEIKTKFDWENKENRLHPMANLEESLEYINMVDFSFYEIVETEIDKSSLRNYQIGKIL